MNGKDAVFSCDISVSGLKLLACIPTSEIGCLKLTGEKNLPIMTDWPVAMQQITDEKILTGDPDMTALVASQLSKGKYTLLDLQITFAKQPFVLNGVKFRSLDSQHIRISNVNTSRSPSLASTF